MAGIKRKFSDFSIEAILEGKKFKHEVREKDILKQERPETPSSTTSSSSLMASYRQSPTVTCSSPMSGNSQSKSFSSSPPPNPNQFPMWTQCQTDLRKSRRPYSKHTVAILSWWFHHLPFLTVEEMETVAMLSSLSRQQVKVWWQNRRHSQRGRQIGEADPYTGRIQHLPTNSGVIGLLPEPGTAFRSAVFKDILHFFYARVTPCILPICVVY